MQDSERSGPSILAGAGVTVAALGLAAAHIASSGTVVDGITLALFGVAALPWLGSVFKSVQFPGGVRAEYWEKRLTAVERKMAEVENAVIYGPDEHSLRKIGRALTDFTRHLDHLGLSIAAEDPKIDLQYVPRNSRSRYVPMSLYDPQTNMIKVDTQAANSPGLTLHEYAHVALCSSGFNFKSDEDPLGGVEAGLATYLTCSYLESPRLGVITFRSVVLRLDGYWLDRHDQVGGQLRRRSASDSDMRGKIWGQVLWQTRGPGTRLEAFAFDRAVASAWRSAAAIDGGTEKDFTAALHSELGTVLNSDHDCAGSRSSVAWRLVERVHDARRSDGQ